MDGAECLRRKSSGRPCAARAQKRTQTAARGKRGALSPAATQAAQEVHQSLLGKKAKLIIIIESLARLKLLGRMTYQEIAEIKKILGPDVPLVGMYSHGEFCPVQSKNQFKKTYYQNGSIEILAIR